jgi:hypothetical protein
MYSKPTNSSEPDKVVGVWKSQGRPVYQCKKTGLLYAFMDRPKRYVPVVDVELNISGPDSEVDHFDAHDEQDDVEVYSQPKKVKGKKK